MQKKFLLVAALLVGLIITAVVIFLNSSQAPSGAKTTREAFMSALLAGDSNKSYELLAPATKQSETTASWKAKVEKFSNFFQGSTPELTGEKTYSEEAQAAYEATYRLEGGDGTYTVKFILLEAESEWQIAVFNSELVAR